MERFEKDLDIVNISGRMCQERVYYSEVISCYKDPYPDKYFTNAIKPSFSGHQPFYELRNDGSGKPYSNVLKL